MDSPFQFGTLATDKNFIDRVEERAELKQMLSSGIHVTLISPRRWGKSSLVKKAMGELSAERKDIRVCYLDAFSINTVDEFYESFAAGVISCTSNRVEKALKDARQYLGGLIPGISISDGLNGILSVNLRYQPQDRDKQELLNLPERIAQDKGIRIVICIDEFQQLANLNGYSELEGKMRSVWQHQKHVSYCFYGSKKHMMLDIFGDSQKPFYRFSNIMFMPKIKKADWMPFIERGFVSTGKVISREQAERICDVTDCHSWYMQQLCYFVWYATDKTVTESILDTSVKRLIDTNAPMFISDTEKLTPSQREMLKAIASGETQLTSESVLSRYRLGNPNTIVRNKKALQEKSFIEQDGGNLVISDPIFRLWYKALIS